MIRPRRHFLALSALLGALATARCTDNPATPNCGYTNVGAVCAPNGAVSVCTATMYTMCSNGFDVTPNTTWTSSNPAIMTLTADGVARAVSLGDADAIGQYSGRSGRARLRVVQGQPPLMRGDMSGPVWRAPSCTEREPGVLVTFTAGIHIGLSTTTNTQGIYTFADIALPPTWTLRFSKPGLQDLLISGLPGYPSGSPSGTLCMTPVP